MKSYSCKNLRVHLGTFWNLKLGNFSVLFWPVLCSLSHKLKFFSYLTKVLSRLKKFVSLWQRSFGGEITLCTWIFGKAFFWKSFRTSNEHFWLIFLFLFRSYPFRFHFKFSNNVRIGDLLDFFSINRKIWQLKLGKKLSILLHSFHDFQLLEFELWKFLFSIIPKSPYSFLEAISSNRSKQELSKLSCKQAKCQ